jgi:hypothetical protein
MELPREDCEIWRGSPSVIKCNRIAREFDVLRRGITDGILQEAGGQLPLRCIYAVVAQALPMKEAAYR